MAIDVQRLVVDVSAKGITGVVAGLTTLDRRIKALDMKRFNAGFAIGLVGGFTTKIVLLGGAITALTGAIGGAVVGLGSFAAALVALPGMIGAVGAGLAGLVGGLYGVVKAFSAYGKAQAQSAADADAVVTANRNMAKAVKALARAREDLARLIEDNAERIADAEQRIVDAQDRVTDASKRLTDATEQIAEAEERVAEAQRRVITAQKALTQAREDATEALEDMHRSLERSQINELRAADRLTDARRRLAEAERVLGDNSEVVARARLDVRDAELDLAVAQDQVKDTTKELAKAEAKGVEGSDQVVAVLESIVDAEKAVEKAKEDVADRIEDEADAQRDLIKANEGVVESQKDLAKTQRDASRAIVDANERIADALEAVSDASKKMGSTGSSAAKEFKSAMDKLSPSAREFVNWLIKIKNDAAGFLKPVQEALLTGLIPALQPVVDIWMPKLQESLVDVNKITNRVVKRLAALAISPQFMETISELKDSGLQVWSDFAESMVNWTEALLNFMRAVSPITLLLSSDLLNLSERARAFTSSQEGMDKIRDIFTRMYPVMQSAATAVGVLVTELGKIITHQPVLNATKELFDALANTVLPVLGDSLREILPKAIELFTALLVAITPVLPELVELVEVMVDELAPVLPDLADIIRILVDGFTTLVPLLPPLVQGLADVVRHLEGMGDAGPAVAATLAILLRFGGATAIIKGLWTALKFLLLPVLQIGAFALGVLAGALGITVGAAAGLIAIVAVMALSLWGHFDDIKKWVTSMVEDIKARIEDFGEELGKIVGLIKNGEWKEVATKIVSLLKEGFKSAEHILTEFFKDWFMAVATMGSEIIVDGVIKALDKIPGLGGIAKFLGGKGDGPGAEGPKSAGSNSGSAKVMATQATMRFPGMRITSGYRTPIVNAMAGGSPTSYHVDKNNPAQDIAGPRMQETFNFLYEQYGKNIREMIYGNQMVKNGKLMKYSRNDHWDHVHVAHKGGFVSESWPTLPGLKGDERPAILQIGEKVVAKGDADLPPIHLDINVTGVEADRYAPAIQSAGQNVTKDLLAALRSR